MKKMILTMCILSMFCPNVYAEEAPPETTDSPAESEEPEETAVSEESEEPEDIVMRVSDGEEPLSGVTVWLYGDAQGETILQNDQEEDIFFVSEEDGTLTVPADLSDNYVCADAPRGYWPMEKPEPVEDAEEIVLDPIHVRVQLNLPDDLNEKDIELVLHEQDSERDDIVFTCAETDDIGMFLTAGRDYVLFIKDLDEGYASSGPVKFSVNPDLDEVELKAVKLYETEVRLSEKVPGAALNVQGEEKTYQAKTDKNGRAAFALPDGTYTLRVEDIPKDCFAIAEPIAFDVKGQGQRIDVPLDPAGFTVRFNDASKYEVSVTDAAGREINRFTNDGSPHFVRTQREQTYTVKAEGLYDCYSLPETAVQVPQYAEEKNVSFTSRPFAMYVSVKDTNGRSVKHLTVLMHNEKDGSEKQLALEEEKLKLTHIHEKDRLTFKLIRVPEGFLAREEVSAEGGECTAVLTVEPYVTAAFSFENGDSGFVYGLYQDENCSLRALDIRGRAVRAESSMSVGLKEGRYYLKQENADAKYFLDPQVYPLDIRQTNGIRQNFPVKLKKAAAILQAVDQNTGKICHGKLMIADALGRPIQEIESSDQPTELERGKTYQLVLKSSEKGYMPLGPIRFRMPETGTRIPVFQVFCEAYGTLTIHAVEGKESSKRGGTYGVFTDAQCRSQALTTEGRLACGKIPETGTLSFAMKPGTYYVKQIESDQSCYRDEQVYRMEVNGENSEQMVEIVPAVLAVAVKDEDGTPVSGVKMALLDENHKAVRTWTSTEETVIQEGVSVGRQYYIQCVSLPQEYRSPEEMTSVTVPEKAGDQTVTNIVLARRETAVHVPLTIAKHEQEDMETAVERKKRAPFALIGLGIAGVLIAIMAVQKCKNLHSMK